MHFLITPLSQRTDTRKASTKTTLLGSARHKLRRYLDAINLANVLFDFARCHAARVQRNDHVTEIAEETEGARFWVKVLTDLKALGVQDVLILCAEGLTGLPDAARTVFPATDVQLCVVHQIRNATKFVSYKDRKAFCADMRAIYTAPTIEAAQLAFERFAQTWERRIPCRLRPAASTGMS